MKTWASPGSAALHMKVWLTRVMGEVSLDLVNEGEMLRHWLKGRGGKKMNTFNFEHFEPVCEMEVNV